MRNSLIFLVAVALLGVSSAHSQEELAGGGQAVSEVRVLIDISGSMKKNDPNNLRVPALKLITQLLPDGARAGVWTFGQYVNMLVPAGKVDRAWKAKAADAVKAINSAGMYTNIEGVLKDATWDWNKPDGKSSRNIIFLTDGMLDISKDPSANQAGRSRVLGELLTRLKGNGITIHTVALSSEADKPFLRQLSAATSGRYEEVANAADLERVFLRMFEKSVPVESLPLTDNKVLVDNSINELTLLVFRKEGAKSATLKTPDGKEIDQSSKLDSVHWQHEERYDLITLNKPMAGEWQVNAELDPDNRVMVVTDLSVRASRLPNMMMSGDKLPYHVELHDKEKIIDKPQFLDFVTIMLNRNHQNKLDKSVPLEDNGKDEDTKAHDGRFSGVAGGDLKPGDYDYELVVNGTTFKRSKRYLVQVVDKPVAVNVTEVSKGDPAHYTLTLAPYAELIKPESLLIDAKATKVGGESAALTIPRTGPNEWRLDMDIRKDDRYEIALSIQAERLDGQHITADLGSYVMGAGTLDAPKEKAVVAAPTPASEAVVKEAAAPAEQQQAAPQPAPEAPAGEKTEVAAESPNWLMIILKVVGVNGVLLLVGFFVYRKWFRKTEPQPEEGAEKEAPEQRDQKK